MSSVDIGIPIGGCIALSGSDHVPANFRALNGAVLDEPRSSFDGTTLPNWNRDDIQTVLTQTIPYDGSVYDSPEDSITFEEKHLPLDISLKKTFKVDFTVPTSTKKSTGLGGEGTIVFGSGNTFTHSIWYGNSMGRVDGKDIGSSGGGQYYYKSDDNEIAYTFLNEHTHSVSYGAHDHDFTAFNTSNSYIGSDVFGIRPSSTNTRSNTINGSSSPNSVSISKERPALKLHWYIRVY